MKVTTHADGLKDDEFSRLQLDSPYRNDLVEGSNSSVAAEAPNLSAVIGSGVALELITSAGGLSTLARMPACNIILLGRKRKNLAATSSESSSFPGCHLEKSEILQSSPPLLKRSVCRLLAAKSELAAKADCTGRDPSGNYGRTLREAICKKIEKWCARPSPEPLSMPEKQKFIGDGNCGVSLIGKSKASTEISVIGAKNQAETLLFLL